MIYSGFLSEEDRKALIGGVCEGDEDVDGLACLTTARSRAIRVKEMCRKYVYAVSHLDVGDGDAPSMLMASSSTLSKLPCRSPQRTSAYGSKAVLKPEKRRLFPQRRGKFSGLTTRCAALIG
jgi:hypothetical protein